MCASERGDMESPGEEAGRAEPSAPHPPATPQTNGSNKIIGRNVNGTSKSRIINICSLLKGCCYAAVSFADILCISTYAIHILYKNI